MNKGYFEQFSDRSIKRLLLDEQNILPLEQILDLNLQQHAKIARKKIDLGIVPPSRGLQLLLDEIRPPINEFLGVNRIKKPKVSYNISILKRRMEGGYLPKIKSIYLRRLPLSDLIPILAHEYTHHVQFQRGIPYYQDLSTFCEGQAHSVQRYVSLRQYVEKDNPAFLLSNFDYDTTLLGEVYVWLMKNLGKPQKSNLVRKIRYHCFIDKPTKPALGNAFFSILEAREGTEIHKEIMAGRYQLPS